MLKAERDELLRACEELLIPSSAPRWNDIGEAIKRLRTLFADYDALQAVCDENRILRGLVQSNPDWKCPYGLDVPTMAHCPSGFPGCACADDRIAVYCEDEQRIVSKLEAKLAEAEARAEEAESSREQAHYALAYIQREEPRITDISADADWPEVRMSVPGGFVTGHDLVQCVERAAEIDAAREGT